MYVKRIIGLPGERIAQKDGVIFINGQRLKKEFVERDRLGGQDFAPFDIPKRSYFMMGDNRDQSCDSRDWGSVRRDQLIGSVSLVYWPINRLSLR